MRENGIVLNRTRLLALTIFFVGSVVAVGLLVYFFADRPSENSPLVRTLPVPPAKRNKPAKSVRLPRTILPEHYEVWLMPIIDVDNFTIPGNVSIEVICKHDTDQIVLHSANIEINKKSVQVYDRSANEELKVGGIEEEVERDFLIIRLGNKPKTIKMKKGRNYTVSMSFVAQLTDELRGFYRSSYEEDGVTRYLAVSQMQATDARRAFPCFDEPNMKATFSVRLGRHKSMISLSNMPLLSSIPAMEVQDYYWDKFEPSVPMSTYLIAFIVANFSRVDADAGPTANWELSLYARPSAKNQLEYAKSVAAKLQLFFEDYFHIPYPLPKQDMVAVPDFAAGAMENWGLIVYAEPFMLLDSSTASLSSKELATEIIAHELSHQWFGNLVTMDWWTDLWLNEGFATYMEFIASHHLEPSFLLDQQFVAKQVQGTMQFDALESSHPISVPVHHPDEIKEIFDHISYGKGGSVIRMLADFLGEKTFRQGLTKYLLSKNYSNAVQDDLWIALTAQAKVDKLELPTSVKEIMDTWSLKMGFPVVTVKRDYLNGAINLSQERFLLLPSSKSKVSSYKWWIPLSYTKNFRTFGMTWMSDRHSSAVLKPTIDVQKDEWIIFNVNQTGFFRVNYDSRNWELLGNQLMEDHTAIEPINRAQIINDALNLARVNQLDYEIALNLTRFLEEKEDEYIVWTSTFSALDYIDSMMSRTAGYGLFLRYVRRLIKLRYEAVGFHPKQAESPKEVMTRTLLVKWACAMGIKDCIENSIRTYKLLMEQPEHKKEISPDLRTTIICTAIREGGEEEWSFALKSYFESNVANEKVELINFLSCTQQPWILAKMLDMTIDPMSGLRIKTDGWMLLGRIAQNHLGRDIALYFIKDNWELLKREFDALSNLSQMLEMITKLINTEAELKKLEEFFKEKQLSRSSIARASEQAIDRIQSNIKWMKESYPKVVAWLKHELKSSTPY